MTWTEKTREVETWTARTPGLHVFSTLVFSHAFYTGKRVFALGASGVEVWDEKTIQAEIWTAA